MRLTLTIHPYGNFKDLVQDPVVEAVRLNTTIPFPGKLENILAGVKAAVDKDIWIDLKCRQLRIKDYNVRILNDHELHYITLSHKLKVKTPSEIWLDDGNYIGVIESIQKGNRVIVKSSVEKGIGLPLADQGEVGIRPGMSVNILDPSLRVKGYFTDKDRAYIKAARQHDMHNYMLSYAEQESDITDLLKLDPDANIIAKIESPKGLDFIENVYEKYADQVHLMAARGDLYVEVERPDQIIEACQKIIYADPEAMFASRLFDSLKDPNKMPRCQDIFDMFAGMQMGYRRYMIGDDICMNYQSMKSAIGLFSVMDQKEVIKCFS